MSSDISEQQNDLASLTDKQIYVVGRRRFQNELLAYFLGRETGVDCRAKDNVYHVPVLDDTNSNPQRQILWDCLGKDPESLMADIESHGKKLLLHDLVALFNVDPDLGIEEKTVALGVRGFFYERDPLDLLLKGVRAIFDGELWLSREIMTKCILKKSRDILSEDSDVILTQRETEILATIAIGYTNDEIANKLCISPHTVKTHIYNIFKKINVPNRLQAALWAAKNL